MGSASLSSTLWAIAPQRCVLNAGRCELVSDLVSDLVLDLVSDLGSDLVFDLVIRSEIIDAWHVI